MSFGGGRMGVRPGEYTKVGLETEVKIPWETYKKLLILGPVSIWFFGWIPGWLIWLRVAMESMSAWRWLTREWWLWASGGGIIWPILMCFLWWGSAPTWATIYRYWIETVYKRTPEYTQWNSENGPWSPGAHRRLERESAEYDAEAETPSAGKQGLYAVEGVLQTSSGSEIYLKFDLEDYTSALKWHNFCKAVYHKNKNFSYNEAVKRNRLSDDDWERIYAAFIAQQWVIPSGPKGTPKLKGFGKAWVHMYAETPPTPPSG